MRNSNGNSEAVDCAVGSSPDAVGTPGCTVDSAVDINTRIIRG